MKKRVGLVGLGLMGAPMGHNWLKKGFELHVLPHRSRQAAEILVKEGAYLSSSLKELAESVDVVVLMVPTSREVEQLTLGQGLISLIGPEQIVIDMSTSDPLSTEKIHKAFAAKDLRFFDAPVTGGVKGAQGGTLTLFIGGPEEWFEETREVLQAVSQTQGHFGAAGKGHVAKLVNNILCIGNLAVFCEALPLAVRMGLDSKKIFDTLLAGTGASEMLKIYGPQVMAGDFQARFKLSHAYKDLKLVENLTDTLDARLPVFSGILEDFKIADEHGLGEKNFSSIIEPLEKLLKAQFRG